MNREDAGMTTIDTSAIRAVMAARHADIQEVRG